MGGLISGLSKGLIGHDEGKRLKEKDEEARLAREAAARHQLLEDQLLSAHARYYDRSPGVGAGKKAGGRTAAQSDAEQHRRFRDLQAQLGDRRAALAAVRKQKLPQRPPLGYDPGSPQERAFLADSAKKAGTYTPEERAIHQQIDSIRTVADSQRVVAAGGKGPPRTDPLAAQRADYDALVKQHGADVVRRRIGPRP